MKEDRKGDAYNCLGNTSWFLDAFMIWVQEMIKYGDYFPGAEIRKASREEVENYVRRTRCNVRVMQGAVDAARHYENLDSGIDEEGLIELHKEVWSLYESIEGLIGELRDDHYNLVTRDHPALTYLSGPGFEAMSHAGFEIMRDFHETIIPPAEG
jgi:hypothetical protein